MKDGDGTVSFAYPNPNTAKYTHFPDYGVKFDLQEEILPSMGYFCRDFKGRTIVGAEKPWLFTSGCRGLVRCEIPLINADRGQQAGVFTVRLGFLAPTGDVPGRRVFDIKLQGKVVHANCDIAQLAGGNDKAVVTDYRGVSVNSSLVVELIPKSRQPSETTAPIVNFIDVRRQQ